MHVQPPLGPGGTFIREVPQLESLRYTTQCNKPNIFFTMHNHFDQEHMRCQSSCFDPLRSTAYHNNILPYAASTLDHSSSLPAKEQETQHSAESISSYTHSGKLCPSGLALHSG